MSKTAVFRACKSWDVSAVTEALAARTELAIARDSRGRTPLHVCAGRKLQPGTPAKPSVEIARIFLNAGADINAVHEIPDDKDTFPATALWYAVARGLNRELAKFLLLDAGASPDYCVWAVVWSGDVETARMLLDAGSRTELKFDGEPPLLYAAKVGERAAGSGTCARQSKHPVERLEGSDAARLRAEEAPRRFDNRRAARRLQLTDRP